MYNAIKLYEVNKYQEVELWVMAEFLRKNSLK